MSDYIGKIFGRLTVESVYMKQCKTTRRTHTICVCECGEKRDVRLHSLKKGHTKSCGCLHKEKVIASSYKHGKTGHPLMRIFNGMKQRCENPKSTRYHDYGGRGIFVCEEWKEFIAFYDWAIENGWQKELQIDRIDNNGNYSPENSRFITEKENSRNRRSNILLTCFNETKTMAEWSEDDRCIVGYHTLYSRIRLGWDHKKAITQKKQERKP